MSDTSPARAPARTAREVGEVAATHAAKAELDRRLGPEVTESIRAAGFARHFVPVRWGGSEGTFGVFARTVAEVAAGDASAAWCASIAATLGRIAAFLPEEGQRAVWGDGPDAFVVGALMPGGNARAVLRRLGDRRQVGVPQRDPRLRPCAAVLPSADGRRRQGGPLPAGAAVRLHRRGDLVHGRYARHRQ
ncbi:hypothetical protein ACRAWF_43230 [Streptomyces sp. L7]